MHQKITHNVFCTTLNCSLLLGSTPHAQMYPFFLLFVYVTSFDI